MAALHASGDRHCLKRSFTICGQDSLQYLPAEAFMARASLSSLSPIPAAPLARLALAALAGAITLAALPAAAEPIDVIVDQAKVMRIARPADLVIIGNPAIADATIQDNQTLIITGKSFGSTNLIVLDAAGQAIADELVTVSPQNDQVVTVYRRAERQTFSCTPDCSPVLAVGDNTQAFDTVNTQIQSHGAMVTGATGDK
jgi:Flp pilus assembly secretin CpaC